MLFGNILLIIYGFQLLSCVAIPVALALSCLVLGVRYRMVHIIAVSVCLIGVGCLVWANIEDTKIDGINTQFFYHMGKAFRAFLL